MSETRDGERIAKVIARAGVASRRDAEKLIAEGRVAVDGKVLSSPAYNVVPGQTVTVNGKPLPEAEPSRLWLYHKPKGLVTSHRDPQGRSTVFASLPASLPRVISVGRLDYNSEGLLLLTNDGEIARRLELPSTGWLRRYRVRVHGAPAQTVLDRLDQGITVDGIAYGSIKATVDKVQGSNAWLTMTLREGKNREIRKVLEFFGMPVSRLIRVAYGPFQLGQLEEGAVREVTGKVLREQLGIKKPEKAEKPGPDKPAPQKPAAERPAAEKSAAPRPAAARPAAARPGPAAKPKPRTGNADRRR